MSRDPRTRPIPIQSDTSTPSSSTPSSTPSSSTSLTPYESACSTFIDRVRSASFVCAVAERAMTRLAGVADSGVVESHGGCKSKWLSDIENDEMTALWQGPSSALGVLDRRLRIALSNHAEALASARRAAFLGILGTPPSGGKCEPAALTNGTMEVERVLSNMALESPLDPKVKLATLSAQRLLIMLSNSVPGSPITRAQDGGARVYIPMALLHKSIVSGGGGNLRDLRSGNEGSTRAGCIQRIVDEYFNDVEAGGIFWEHALNAAAEAGGGGALNGSLIADAAYALATWKKTLLPLSIFRVLAPDLTPNEIDAYTAVVDGANSLIEREVEGHCRLSSHECSGPTTKGSVPVSDIKPLNPAVSAALDALESCFAAPASTIHCRIPLKSIPLGWAFVSTSTASSRVAESLSFFSAQPAALGFVDYIEALTFAVKPPAARAKGAGVPFLGGLRLALRALSLGGALARAVEAESAALKTVAARSRPAVDNLFTAVSARGGVFFSEFCDNVRNFVVADACGDRDWTPPSSLIDAETAAREAVTAGRVAAVSLISGTTALEKLVTRLRWTPTTSTGSRSPSRTPVLTKILRGAEVIHSQSIIAEAVDKIATKLSRSHSFVIPTNVSEASVSESLKAVARCSRATNWECMCSKECANIVRALKDEAAHAKARCANCECQNILS